MSSFVHARDDDHGTGSADGGTAVTGRDTALSATVEEVIRAEIRRDGRITFDRFMELALYHPTLGYYNAASPRIGPEGDYYTSTDVSPLFGATLGRQLHEMWRLLGEPEPFTIVEYGAGRGLLAADILGWAGAAHPGFYRVIRYVVVELSAAQRERQRGALAALPVTWIEERQLGRDAITGCFLSNELADALPFHRLRRTGGELRELWVEERGDGLGETPGELSTPELRWEVERWGVPLLEGHAAEVNLRATRWMAAQVAALRSGYVLTIDYGGLRRELLDGRHPDGTLACYHRHTRNTAPFERIGEQDITAHVDFTALARAARDAGAEIAGYASQGYFLAALGLGEALVATRERAPSAAEWAREREAVARLAAPDGLGGFRVLAARKAAPETTLAGFALGAEPI